MNRQHPNLPKYPAWPIPQLGFSLIELMMVTSIISIIVAFSIPSYTIFKIRAAQAEFSYNLKAITTLAHSYHAETSVYPINFTYGCAAFGQDAKTEYINNCNTNNAAGFRTTDPTSLRYTYYFYREGGRGNAIDGSGMTRFTAVAWALYREAPVSLGGGAATGRGPPAKCAISTGDYGGGGSLSYFDSWTIYENGALQPESGDPSNAVKNCFVNSTLFSGG